MFDVKFGLAMFFDFFVIMIPSLCLILSYGLGNYFGMWTTQLLGATARTTIEQCRTLLVWCVGLIVGWETFLWPQILGFVVLVLGASVYNRVIRFSFFKYPQAPPQSNPSAAIPLDLSDSLTSLNPPLIHPNITLTLPSDSYSMTDAADDHEGGFMMRSFSGYEEGRKPLLFEDSE